MNRMRNQLPVTPTKDGVSNDGLFAEETTQIIRNMTLMRYQSEEIDATEIVRVCNHYGELKDGERRRRMWRGCVGRVECEN